MLAAVAIVFFFVGVLSSRLYARSILTKGHPRRRVLLYGLECLLLLAWMLIALKTERPSSVPILIAVGALAMGIQNAATTHFHTLTTRTTHVTGLITELADQIAQGIESSSPGRAEHVRRGTLLFLCWLSYCAGATGAGLLLSRIGIVCLGVVVGLLTLLIAYELFWRRKPLPDQPTSK